MRQHGLYKYVCDGEIIYIGKSNANIYNRIKDHTRETKFKPYLQKGVEIYTCLLPNSAETDILEKALINQYKPVLNGTDNQPGFSSHIEVNEPAWTLFNEHDYMKSQTPNKRKNVKQPFPSEFIDVPYFAIEQEKSGRNYHDMVVIAPNGRINMAGHATASSELLKYRRECYPSIKITFYENSHREGWHSHEYKNCNYNPQEVYRHLIMLCERVLLHDYNFGSNYQLKLSTNENSRLLYDLLTSSISVTIPNHFTACINLYKSIEGNYNSCEMICNINKENFFIVYLASLLSSPETFDYKALLSLYFKIHYCDDICRDDICLILECAGLESSAYKSEINRIRGFVGGEFYDDRLKREHEEYVKKARTCYYNDIERAFTHAEKARFAILDRQNFYIINNNEKDIIEALIHNYSHENDDTFQANNEDLIWVFKINEETHQCYPEITLFNNDYNKLIHTLFNNYIPFISINKKFMCSKSQGMIDLSSDWKPRKNTPYNDVFRQAIEIMLDAGF